MNRKEKRRLAWESLRGKSPQKDAARPYLGVRFDCCSVYARVYRDPEADVYRGRCPRCLRSLRVRVTASGTSDRFFRAW